MNRLAARINWLWRLVMTGFCFALFGVGGLLLSLVWFNLLLIVQRDGDHDPRFKAPAGTAHANPPLLA